MGSSPIQVATFASVAQLVEQRTENPRVVGSIPTGGTIIKQSAHVPIVWYSPFFASISCGFSSFGRAPPCQGGGGGFEPRNPLQKRVRKGRFSYPIFSNCAGIPLPCTIRRHSQAVRQRSAKPSSPVRFRVAPPRRVDKKDANRKTRDFLGFSSFFAVFLTFLKFGF